MLQDFPKMIAVAHSPLTRVLIPHVFQKSECLLFQKDSVAHILYSIIYSISRSTSGSNYSLTLEQCAIENPHRSYGQSSVYVVTPYPSFLCIYSSTYTDSTSYDCAVLGYLLLKSWNYNTLATWCKELTHLKRLWCWERLKAGGEGDNKGWDGWMASPTHWIWVWASSGSWWWTGKPGVLQSMGLQRVRNDWATELNWPELLKKNLYKWICTAQTHIVKGPLNNHQTLSFSAAKQNIQSRWDI